MIMIFLTPSYPWIAKPLTLEIIWSLRTTPTWPSPTLPFSSHEGRIKGFQFTLQGGEGAGVKRLATAAEGLEGSPTEIEERPAMACFLLL